MKKPRKDNPLKQKPQPPRKLHLEIRATLNDGEEALARAHELESRRLDELVISAAYSPQTFLFRRCAGDTDDEIVAWEVVVPGKTYAERREIAHAMARTMVEREIDAATFSDLKRNGKLTQTACMTEMSPGRYLHSIDGKPRSNLQVLMGEEDNPFSHLEI